jgi:hypothetical protein
VRRRCSLRPSSCCPRANPRTRSDPGVPPNKDRVAAPAHAWVKPFSPPTQRSAAGETTGKDRTRRIRRNLQTDLKFGHPASTRGSPPPAARTARCNCGKCKRAPHRPPPAQGDLPRDPPGPPRATSRAVVLGDTTDLSSPPPHTPGPTGLRYVRVADLLDARNAPAHRRRTGCRETSKLPEDEPDHRVRSLALHGLLPTGIYRRS